MQSATPETPEPTSPSILSRVLTALPFLLCAVVLVALVDNHLRGDRIGLGAEDGPLEWGTVFFFGVCAALALTARFANGAELPKPERRLLVVFAVVLLVGIGEELSWGQRIFGWDPPQWMSEDTDALIAAGHDDTTLHNLSFDGEYLRFSVGGVLFGVVMLGAVGMHGIWLPITYRKGERAPRWLVERLGVFVPPLSLGLLVFGVGTTIYVMKKIGTQAEETEFIELVVPMVYAFILLRCYFSGRRGIDRVVSAAFIVLLCVWLGATTMVVVRSAQALS